MQATYRVDWGTHKRVKRETIGRYRADASGDIGASMHLGRTLPASNSGTQSHIFDALQAPCPGVYRPTTRNVSIADQGRTERHCNENTMWRNAQRAPETSRRGWRSYGIWTAWANRGGQTRRRMNKSSVPCPYGNGTRIARYRYHYQLYNCTVVHRKCSAFESTTI